MRSSPPTRPGAIVEAYLGGQAGSGAIADILWGVAEPGGRLAESFPVHMSDLPADRHFPSEPTQVEYREGMYVGYRFHDAADVAALFPFGHGLSYTSFAYSDLTLRKKGQARTVSLTVTNTGDRTGSDVVQVYVRGVAMASSGGMSLKQLDALIRMLNATSVKAWRGSRRRQSGT